MRHRFLFVSIGSLLGGLSSIALAGCSDPTTPEDADVGGDADADVDADAGPDADVDADADFENDADVEADALDADLDVEEDSLDADTIAVHDVGWRLHDEIESLVYVSWAQDVAGAALVQYRIGGEEWQRTPLEDRAVGSQEQLVLGIPFDTEFSFQVVVVASGHELLGEVVTGRTGLVPETMPLPALEVSVPERWDPADRYLFGSISVNEGGWAPPGGFWAFIIDRQGRLLWARLTPRQRDTMYVRVSTNGRDFLLDDASYWSDFDGGAASSVLRIKIDGTILDTYPTPGLHHAFTELDDGAIVWGAAEGPGGESLEMLSPDGSRLQLWDCASFFASIGSESWGCQSNALFWDVASRTFFYSFFTSSFIVQVDPSSEDTPRYFGNIRGAYAFDPPDSAFHWQHGVTITSAGTLMTSSHLSESSSEGVVREYVLDDATRTLRQVWTWGEGNGTDAGTAGEAHRLANGDTLINYGSSPVAREITPDGDIVWEVRWVGSRMLGRTIYIDDLYDFAP